MKFYLSLFYFFIVFLSIVDSTSGQNNPVSFSRIATPNFSYNAIIALPNPQKGEMAYDSTFNCLRVYNGTKWVCTFQNPSDANQNMAALITVGGSYDDRSYSVAVDATGNVYITGYFSETVSFGTITKTSISGNADIFIAKYNSSGFLQWVQTAGSQDTDISNGIALDANGNVYVTGHFSQSITFETTVKTSLGLFDVFVAKYNNNGIFQWVQTGGGTNNDYGQAIAVDANQNVYVTGFFTGIATFDNVTKTSAGNTDMFVTKYDSNGIFQWLQTGGGTNSDDSYGIVTDNIGNVYISGSFVGLANFGAFTVNSISNSADIFIAKYNSSGTSQWIRTSGGASNEYGRSITIDNNGNLYNTGFFAGTATFGNTSKTASVSFDVFIEKFDYNGTSQWVQTAGGTGEEYGQDITVDSGGNIYVTGYFNGTTTFGTTSKASLGGYDMFIAKYNSIGALQWLQTSGGASNDYQKSIAVDLFGNVYSTGYFSGTAIFGNTSKTSLGFSDVFVTRLQQ